jgi:nucleoside-diphosphate-sugar epimerase
VRDTKAVRDAVGEADPDVVFHLAAVGVTNPAVDPMLALMVNAGGAVNLLEALRGSDVQRVVLVGTSHEYGAQEAMEGLDPFSAYAASKVAAWAYGRMYWRAYGLPVVTVRPFQVYGPGQPEEGLIPAAIRAALSGEDFPMTPGEQELDFIYVEDVADGMMSAAEAPEIEGKSLDLGTGVGCAIRRVVDQIWQLTDAGGEVCAGALPYRSGRPMRLVADAERTAQLTGWRATTPLDEGLSATIQSLAQRG